MHRPFWVSLNEWQRLQFRFEFREVPSMFPEGRLNAVAHVSKQKADPVSR